MINNFIKKPSWFLITALAVYATQIAMAIELLSKGV